jgi:hypothetical protein
VNVIVILLVTLLLAFLIETLVEYFVAPFFNNIPKLAGYKWTQMYIAMAIGLVSAFVYRLDLVSLLSQFLSQVSTGGSVLPTTTFGIIITGTAIGRGSNYLHDLVMKFFTKDSITTLPSGSSTSTEDSSS